MRHYKCPDCKTLNLVKQVYTEEYCLNCDHTEHHPHKEKSKGTLIIADKTGTEAKHG